MPRFEPHEPPPAVELGWLVLKNVVLEIVTAVPTFFSPARRLIFQPKSFTPSTFVASNTSVELMGRTVAVEFGTLIDLVLAFITPSSKPLASRSLIMKKACCTLASNGCSRSPAPISTAKCVPRPSLARTKSGGKRNLRLPVMSVLMPEDSAAIFVTFQLVGSASLISARQMFPQVSPVYSRSAKPSRLRSSTDRSEGMAHVMSACAKLCVAPVGAGPTCHSTLPLKASTTRMPRPFERVTVVGLPVAPVMVQVPSTV